MSSGIFRIEAFVDRKHLPDIIDALSGNTLNPIIAQPVANVILVNGVMRAATDGSLIEQLREHIKKNQITEITPDSLKKFVVSQGRRASSYSNLLTDAKAAGILNRVKGLHGRSVKYKVEKK
jgi:hypothetical protein